MALDCSSQFRRSGQRDERRRRLLAEESTAESRPRRRRRSANDADTINASPHYGDVAMEEQPRVTDLVPRALWAHLLLAAAGTAMIAGLILLYRTSVQLGHLTTDGRIAAFDLDGEGSLAVWFSSTTLLAAAVFSALVYSVRRHRVDDYHGRYHIWLWAALIWVVMSLDETASLHEGFKNMMVVLTGTPIIPGSDGSVWWAVPYFGVLGALGSRLLIDMRPSRLSIGALLAAGGCFAVAVAQQLEWILTEAGARGVMLEEGAEMAGYWLLMMAMGLHARWVVLDAEGLIPVKPAKSSDEIDRRRDARLLKLAGGTPTANEEDTDDEDTGQRWFRVDDSDLSPRPVLRRRAPEDDEPATDEGEDPTAESFSPVGRKLTKQEKKALRRRLLRERQERERRQQRKWAS